MKELCYKIQLGKEGEDSTLVSPTGLILTIGGTQSFRSVINFVEELNSLKPSYKKAWDKFMAWRPNA